jgi:hypothetical protein
MSARIRIPRHLSLSRHRSEQFSFGDFSSVLARFLRDTGYLDTGLDAGK